jgi:hypothetical protein
MQQKIDKRLLGTPTKVYKKEGSKKIFIGVFPTISKASEVANITEEAVHYVLKYTKRGIEKYTLSGYTFIIY